MVWLGSTAGQVVSWSDTQVVATVASGSLTGIARIQQNDAWSNAFGFWVMPPGSNAVAQITSRLNPAPSRYAGTPMQGRRNLFSRGNLPGSNGCATDYPPSRPGAGRQHHDTEPQPDRHVGGRHSHHSGVRSQRAIGHGIDLDLQRSQRGVKGTA